MNRFLSSFSLWPRTLFLRLALLMLIVMVLAQAVTWFAFRQARERSIVEQFSPTKIAPIQGIRSALENVPRGGRQAAFAQLNRDYGAYIVPAERRPDIGITPRGARFDGLAAQLKQAFGPETALRIGAREGKPIVWLKLSASDQSYWVGLPADAKPATVSWRTSVLVLTLLALLFSAAYWFARRATQPLKLLATAAGEIGRGQPSAPIPETGPAEIAAVAKGFNQMREDLSKLEQERALMLAGVSHDIRTPLTRLKLELELAGLPDATKHSLGLEVDEIERTLGQFLDFARLSARVEPTPVDISDLLNTRVARERARRGDALTAAIAPALSTHGHAASIDRAVTNLIDNAFRYGRPPVEVTATQTICAEGTKMLEIAVNDRGDGVSPDDIARLLQPFTRGETARTNADGAGLGLAIVERIARQHGGTFTLSNRQGGGACARISLPTHKTPSIA